MLLQEALLLSESGRAQVHQNPLDASSKLACTQRVFHITSAGVKAFCCWNKGGADNEEPTNFKCKMTGWDWFCAVQLVFGNASIAKKKN